MLVKNRFNDKVIGEFDISPDADLHHANLLDADLRDADLHHANLLDADLRDANLRGADLRDADLRGADLRGADLYGANLSGANLRHANLYGANLLDADLRGANLSNSKGLTTAKEYMEKFEKDAKGWIVYKAVGNTHYSINENWKIEPDEFLEEVPNSYKTDSCGCGVNFATLQWIKNEFVNPTSSLHLRIAQSSNNSPMYTRPPTNHHSSLAGPVARRINKI